MNILAYSTGTRNTPSRTFNTVWYAEPVRILVHMQEPAFSALPRKQLQLMVMDDFGTLIQLMPYKDQLNYSMQGCKYEC